MEDIDHTVKWIVDNSAKHRGPVFIDSNSDGKANLLQIDYEDLRKRVRAVSSFLIELGMQKGTKVAIVSENFLEWELAYLATMYSGGVIVPFAPKTKDQDLEYLINFSDAEILIASDMERAVKLNLGKVHKRIELSELAGISKSPANDRRLDDILISPDDEAEIVFTSGTTGNPKGVVLTQGALAYDSIAAFSLLKTYSRDRMLFFIPPDHTYGSTCNILVPVYDGMSVVIQRDLSPASIKKALREYQPTLLLGVQRFFDLLVEGIEREIKKAPEKYRKYQTGMRLSAWFKDKVGINPGKMIFKELHRQLGADIRICINGGGPINQETQRKMELWGIPYLPGYGLTETAPIASVTPFTHPWLWYLTKFYNNFIGASGALIPGVKVKTVDVRELGLFPSIHGNGSEGEIAISGPILTTGYYKNQGASEAVLIPSKIDGEKWLMTGDVGEVRRLGGFWRFVNLFLRQPDAMVCITDRAKDIIVNEGGENVYPSEIEPEFENFVYDYRGFEYPFVKEIVVIGTPSLKEGSGGEVVTAVIVPDARAMEEYQRRSNTTFTEESLRAFFINNILARINSKVAPQKRVQNLLLYDGGLPRTNTLKVKKPIVREKWGEWDRDFSLPRLYQNQV